MSFKSKLPFYKRKMRKEAEKRAKEEAIRMELERKRKAEESKKKKTLLGLGIVFIIVCGFVGFMAATSNETEKTSDSSPKKVSASTQTKDSVNKVKEKDNKPQDEDTSKAMKSQATAPVAPTISLANIPAFSGSPYIVINDNNPYFSDEELSTTSFESYGDLDSLGRCSVAYASVGQDIMPTAERGEIGDVKPSGWHTVKYDNIDGKYLYNRCHLIGYQLTGENANTKNLITGTRYMNTEGMLPFENMVADYVKSTGNHVQYRVTPIFDGDNLIASGVLMEAKSVEDAGAGILFNVYCYNNQPEITINYATGDSSQDAPAAETAEQSTPVDNSQANAQAAPTGGSGTYVLNTNTKKFHYPTCSSVSQMKDSNRQDYTGSRDDLIAQGYEPCKRCNP